MSSTATSSNKPKRRACDECRQRKLACSKDADGCVRCIKENISCVFSEQKQMGRPRKRQIIEVQEDANVQIDPLNLELPIFDDGYDFLDGFEYPFSEPYLASGFQAPMLPKSPTAENMPIFQFGEGGILGGPSTGFGNINFTTTSDRAPAPDLEQPFSMSYDSSLVDSDSNGEELEHCDCLAKMSLTLQALHSAPKEIEDALRVVREAAGIASKSLWCCHCGYFSLEKSCLPIEAFQNTMLLGTIIPTIANGYKRLLEMIDVETENATATGRSKNFSLKAYGGMPSSITVMEQEPSCRTSYDLVDLPPAQWRTIVRALLRVDIYGHEQQGCKQKGLKDLVSEMEARQILRHDMLDIELAAGNMDIISKTGHGIFGDMPKCSGLQDRGCMQIIKMAQLAVDSLVIA